MMINHYGLIKAAKILRVLHLIREDSAKATDILEFLEVLSLNRNTLIAGETYNNNKNRRTLLRRTQHLPREEELHELRTYIISRMQAMLEDKYLKWTATEFVE